MTGSTGRLRRARASPKPVRRDHPAAVFFVDESGSKGSGGQFFVVGAVKTRKPGHLLREVEAVRDAHRFRGEFKFVNVNHGSVRLYEDLIDVLAGSDAHLKAFVIDKRLRDPFEGVPQWSAHARVISQLLVGSINMNELATVLLDAASTPTGVALDEVVRDSINDRFECLSVVSSIALDSKSSSGLQLADLVASAVAYDRKLRFPRQGEQAPDPRSPKAQVVRALCSRFGVPDLSDVRRGRVSILTSRPARAPKLGKTVSGVTLVSDAEYADTDEERCPGLRPAARSSALASGL